MSNNYERTTETGWTVRAWPEPGLPTYKIIAVAPDGKKCIHRPKSTEAELDAFCPERAWSRS